MGRKKTKKKITRPKNQNTLILKVPVIVAKDKQNENDQWSMIKLPHIPNIRWKEGIKSCKLKTHDIFLIHFFTNAIYTITQGNMNWINEKEK